METEVFGDNGLNVNDNVAVVAVSLEIVNESLTLVPLAIERVSAVTTLPELIPTEPALPSAPARFNDAALAWNENNKAAKNSIVFFMRFSFGYEKVNNATRPSSRVSLKRSVAFRPHLTVSLARLSSATLHSKKLTPRNFSQVVVYPAGIFHTWKTCPD